jgi:hypothetical protein
MTLKAAAEQVRLPRHPARDSGRRRGFAKYGFAPPQPDGHAGPPVERGPAFTPRLRVETARFSVSAGISCWQAVVNIGC